MLIGYFVPCIVTLGVTISWYLFYGLQSLDLYRYGNHKVGRIGKRVPNVPSYMWDIYQRGEVDVVKSVYPNFVGNYIPSIREFKFTIPKKSSNEILLKAEIRMMTEEAASFNLTFKFFANGWRIADVKSLKKSDRGCVSLHVTQSVKKLTVDFILIVVSTMKRMDWKPLLLLYYTTVGMRSQILRRTKRNVDVEVYEEETNQIWEKDGLREVQRVRNSCRRKPLYVQFSEINYDTWIIAPGGYEAYQCIGKCYFPVSEHLTPTKHAIIQTQVHNMAPHKASRACCVPTRLGPISVLYVDSKGVLTYRFRYHDMVVEECGCR